jgi:hypothetical protein
MEIGEFSSCCRGSERAPAGCDSNGLSVDSNRQRSAAHPSARGSDAQGLLLHLLTVARGRRLPRGVPLPPTCSAAPRRVSALGRDEATQERRRATVQKDRR